MRAPAGPAQVYKLSNMKLSTAQTLAAGASLIIAAGRILHGMIGTGAGFVTLTRVEASDDGGTNWTVIIGDVSNYDGRADGVAVFWPHLPPSDGASLRITNSSGANVTAFRYFYTEEEAL